MINDILEQIDPKSYIKSYDATKVLSMNMLDTFYVYEANLLSTNFYIFELKNVDERIANIEMQIKTAEEKLQKNVVLYIESVTNYEAKKLIFSQTSFITSKGEYYIPFLALKMKMETEKVKKQLYSDKFSPNSQLLFLYMLYSHDNEFDNKNIIKALQMNEMSFSRAVNDLMNKKLLKYKISGKTGRKKIYYIDDKIKYYSDGKDYLFNPISNEFFVNNNCKVDKLIKAGVSGLSERTMISNDNHNTYGVYKKEFTNINKYIVGDDIGLNENYNRILLLKYNPKLITIEGKMDPITLLLTIRDKNERIESAISEMMGEYEWYTV